MTAPALPADFEQLFDDPLDVDEPELVRNLGTHAVIGDETVAFLRNENRMGVAKGRATAIEDDALAEGMAAWQVPLVITVHAHPKCEFDYARLAVDLAATDRSVISDMSPMTIEGEPQEIETTVGIGLKFKTIAKIVDVEADPSVTRKRTVYFPRIISSGIGFQQAVWDFHDDAGAGSHSHRELNLLILAPAGVAVKATFKMRATVQMKGVAGRIPLLRRTGKIDETYILAAP